MIADKKAASQIFESTTALVDELENTYNNLK